MVSNKPFHMVTPNVRRKTTIIQCKLITLVKKMTKIRNALLDLN
jgi:hypothetical protein